MCRGPTPNPRRRKCASFHQHFARIICGIVLGLGMGSRGATMPRIKILGPPLRNRIRRVETRVARMLAPAYAAIIRSMRVLHYRRRTPNAFRSETYPDPTALPNEIGRSLPKLLRNRAEECRTLARIVTDQQERDGYLTMAQAYEALAAQEEATRNELERRALVQATGR